MSYRPLLLVVGIAALLAGCGEKEMELRFVNATTDTAKVYVREKGFALTPPIAVDPGAEETWKTKIDKDFLPVAYTVHVAGLESSPLRIDGKTDKKQTYIIEDTKIIGPLGPDDVYEGHYERDVEKVESGIILE